MLIGKSFINKDIYQGAKRTISEYLNWDIILYNYKFTEEELEEYYKLYNKKLVSESQILSEEFIDKHEEDLIWAIISRFQTITEGLIDRHNNKFNEINLVWENLSQYQKLSSYTINKYLDKFIKYIDNLVVYQEVPEEIFYEYKDEINWDLVKSFHPINKNILKIPYSKWYYIFRKQISQVINSKTIIIWMMIQKYGFN